MHHNSTHRGFVLLPVVLLITLISVVAFMVNHESVLDSGITASNVEAAQADHVAQAGLAHATWATQVSGCAGDLTLPVHTIDAGDYSATVTTPGGTTTAYNLSADQDAWFRSDQPTVNNGTNANMQLRMETGNLEYALYRFDLSSLPAGAQINSASVWLYVKPGNGEHPEGPLTIHRVTSDWTESGATWDTMSTNFDSAIIATIPAQPQNSVWVRVNLTAQVQAWANGGQPNFGILLRPTAEGTHGKYMSREGPAAEQPRLEVVVGTGAVSPAAIQATGTLPADAMGNTISRTLERNAVTTYQPASSLFLQPDATRGLDAFIVESDSSLNYGADTRLPVQDNAASDYRSLLKFAIGAIPPGVSVQSATLELYQNTVAGFSAGPVHVYRVTNSWDEGNATGASGPGVSWDKRNIADSWDTPGADYDATSVATTTVATQNTWYQWDITRLVRDWVNNGLNNNGLLLVSDVNGTDVEFASSDDADATLHPKLTVTFACECGRACIAPQGSGSILMVGGYQGFSPDPDDVQKEVLLESWGYDVDIWDDNFLWIVNFNNYDVVYVSETAVSTAVNTQLTNLAIGVVNEEGGLNDELGIAAGSATVVGASVNVIDNSHYITAPFPGGVLPIYSASMEGVTVSGAEAPGLQTLADWGGAGSLVVLDQGMQVLGGSTAAGRRVSLPLGKSTTSKFNWDYLNANGRLIVQRALQWGTSNTGGAPPKNLLLVVVDPSSLTVQEAAKKVLIESWGYVVNLIDVDDSQAAFDAAVASNDVVFITEDISSNALGTKLVNANIGVVTEEDNLSDEFGLAQSIVWESGTALEINDNSHYITSPFSLGSLTVLSASDSLAYVTGTLAPTLGKLASIVSGYALVTLESGAATYGGGTAAGRRAQLPWGGNDFDVNNLTADGLTIFQRALEWGAGVGGVAPQTILFVVPDATSLGPQDTVKKSLMESWGYNVALITAADSQVNFDAAVASADVAYISEEILSSDMGTKLRDATIGVVIEETALTDEFGIAGTRTGYTGTGIEVVDITHYITSVFANGPLTIASSASALNRLTGSLAPGLDTLAETTGNPELATIDAGSQLYDGGTAAGRRVQLPWGATDFDINLLNTDGQALMRRAIEWGAGAGGPAGPIAHWKLDDGSGGIAVDSEGGNDGTLIGPAWTTGQLGGALDFDGVNDRVDAGTFDVSGSGLTLSGWFYADSIPTNDPRIVSKASSSAEADAWWQLSTTDSGSNRYLRMRIKASGTTTTFADSSVNLTPGQWYFAAGTYDAASGAMKLYLDGAEIASGTHAVGGPVDTDPTVPVAIGANGSAERFFDGRLDDVRVYDRALGSGEIATLAAAGGGGGGGGGCNGTYRDQFDNRTFDGTNGSIDWTNPWIEVGESNGTTSGDIQVMNDVSNYQLRIRDNDNGGEGVKRAMGLAGAGSASLNLQYRRQSLDSASDYVSIQASSTGVDGTFTEIGRIDGDTVSTDSSYQTATYPLASEYLIDQAAIRLISSSTMGGSDIIWFDDIEVVCTP